jgi:hypothetical protein
VKAILPTIIVLLFLAALAAWIISAVVGGSRRDRGERDRG